jgi:hypothetical protein
VKVTSDGYRVLARRDGGITGELHGTDLEELLDDLKRWARRVDAGHSHDR